MNGEPLAEQYEDSLFRLVFPDFLFLKQPHRKFDESFAFQFSHFEQGPFFTCVLFDFEIGFAQFRHPLTNFFEFPGRQFFFQFTIDLDN
ncbi:MAG: hypothetical protein P1U85_03295 [Verrucomicrobiales bacterium]|nr:hypothetical protein [Verrucomicrobiales bacterium]